MQVRKAEPHEIPAVVEMAAVAYEWGTGREDFDRTVSAGNWIHFLHSGQGVVFIAVDESNIPAGFICGYKSRNIDTGLLVAQVWHWFVDPRAKGHGISLLRRFEFWARSNGCDRIATGCLVKLWDERHRKIYEKLGYKLESMNFVKEN